MNYSETLEFLASRGNEVQQINLGLHRTSAMMQALGNPQKQVPVIHIAGTNGKGSVAAMCETILRQAGWVTGLYTSPHLVRIEERIRIDNCEITPRSFAALATRVQATEADLLKRKLLDRQLTLFEFITVCTFLHFFESEIDIAVIEVGLGGKLDATNVVSPHVCIITGVSLDHQNLLGNTLTKIAEEKAGIIKPRVPVISGCLNRAPARVVRNKALELDAPLLELSRDCKIQIGRQRKGQYSFDLQTRFREYRNLRLSLRGEHQIRNAALAVMAIETLRTFPVNTTNIRRGLATTKWPGRLDEYRSYRRTLLDGAHNPEGAELLRDFILSQKEPEVHLVFGALRDKDVRKMSAALFPVASSIHLAPVGNSRSADPKTIMKMNPNVRNRIQAHGNSHEALYAAWNRCSRSGLVVVTGSLYFIGELLPTVQKWPDKIPTAGS